MNNNLRIINYIYKPHKYTIKGKVKILRCDGKDIVIKPKCDHLDKIYKYLSSRNFDNYLPLIDSERSGYDIFPYVYENPVTYEQKTFDLSSVVALLHAKTSYNKEVDQNIYDNIYYDILNNCKYLEDYYSNLYDEFFLTKYHKPHEILFMDNYSKINNAIGFCSSELEEWYSLVSSKNYQRVSMIHDNLCTNHLLKGNDDILISFDKARFDTPVLDMVKFYKNEYNNVSFSNIFSNYLYHFSYNDDEIKLFFILVSMPYLIDISVDNYKNVTEVYGLCNYIKKTEELVRPYYSHNKEEE